MDLSNYKEAKPHRIKRYIWIFINNTIFRWLPGTFFCKTRNRILNLFGAEVYLTSMIYPTCKIFAPWNLKVGKYSCIGPKTEIYNKAMVIIKDNCVISQGAFFCTAGHDIEDVHNSLITAPIIMEDKSWVASDAYVGMGVTIGEGAVVGARGCVYKDVTPWTVVGGNPAKFIKARKLKNRM